MKKTVKLILPVILITVGFLLFGQFSCSRKGDVSKTLFGNTERSPMREDSAVSKASDIQNAFTKIFSLYKDSVVYITTEQIVRVPASPLLNDPVYRWFFGEGGAGSTVQKRTGLGTGFIISKDGYICTNYHVVAGVDKVFISLNGNTYEASIVGLDKNTDVALLKINADELQPVYFGDSDKVNVGDWAIAIGNPFGLDRTFTVGVVSAVGRGDVDMMGSSHIQTDASINPGNSGGPLINIYGEVIGINRMIYSQSGGFMGIGFAVPMNTARAILAQLKEHKKVKRGYLGVSILNMTESTARELGLDKANGAFVGEVVKGSPADAGGVKVGDVVIEIDGIPVKTYRDLLNIVGQSAAGQRMKITVWRKRAKVNLFVTLKERPDR